MYSAAIVDLDGVVWRGRRLISENVEALRTLLKKGVKIVFLTNNSTRSRLQYAELLSHILDTSVSDESVVNSGYSASVWLRRKHGERRVLVVGMEGLTVEAHLQGHRVLDYESWEKAEAVLVGLDRGVTYYKFAAAHKAIVRGALFIATNTDRSFPVENGTEPGAGALVDLLVSSTGRTPVFDAGKPNRWILDLALEKIGGIPTDRIVVIGDRLDTDIEMASRAGLDSILVLTGITREAPSVGPRGMRVYRNLMDAVREGIFDL
ncbi:MAG: HAD-IIA family hydrolase [Desulfurococcales archaeon]|nr:HAD-IIA family hydrolase [Desulfurococcales archaeon]